MNQYFYLMTVQAKDGPAHMSGVTIWEHGATRHELFDRLRRQFAAKLKTDPDYLPVLNFILERNT